MVCINVSIMGREEKGKGFSYHMWTSLNCLILWWWCYPCFKIPSKYFGISCRSHGSVSSNGHQTYEVLTGNIFALHISTHVCIRHRDSIASHVAWEYAGSEIAHEYQKGISGISVTALFLDLYWS